MRILHSLTLTSLLLIAAAPCSTAQSDLHWGTSRQNNQRTGRSPVVSSQTGTALYPETVIPLTPQPVFEPVSGPDGTVYFTIWKTLYAIDPQTGTELFQVPNAGDATTIGPDGRLFVASGSLGDTTTPGWVKAYQPDGTLDWTFTMPTPGGPLAPLTIGPDGTIYGSTRVILTPVPVQEAATRFALDPNGQLLWLTSPTGMAGTVPMSLSDDGKLFEVDGNNRLRSIDPSTGATLWSFGGTADLRALGVPVVAGNLVVVCVTKGAPAPTSAALTAFDNTTGAQAWSVPFTVPVGIYSVANIFPTPLVMSNGDFLVFWNRMYRIDPTGQLVQSSPFPSPMNEYSRPIAGADDTIYTFDADTSFLAFTADSGQVKFVYTPVDGCLSSTTPAILNDGSLFLAWKRKTVCENFTSTTRYTTLEAGTVDFCQTDLGFGGPGSSVLELCGSPLESGLTSTLRLTGGPPKVPLWLLVGAGSNPIPLFGGTVVPDSFLLVRLGKTNLQGNSAQIQVQGGGGPFSAFIQALCFDPSQPGLFGLSNALEAVFLP